MMDDRRPTPDDQGNTFNVSCFTSVVGRWSLVGGQAIIILATILVLVVMPVRVMMQPWIIQFEYNRPGFPPDLFGMDRVERERLALAGVESISGPRGMDALRQARFDDGTPAFTGREISHMDDVRRVTGGLYTAQGVALILLVVAAVWFYRDPRTRPVVAAALRTGAQVTGLAVVGVGIFMMVAWNVFFTAFHRIFFAGDSWLFSYSDTLIRLYPVQFWIDVAVMMCVAIIGESLVVGAVAWGWQARLNKNAARP